MKEIIKRSCMSYVKIWRHQHTRVHAHTGPRRHARAPACHRHHIPWLSVRRQEITYIIIIYCYSYSAYLVSFCVLYVSYTT